MKLSSICYLCEIRQCRSWCKSTYTRGKAMESPASISHRWWPIAYSWLRPKSEILQTGNWSGSPVFCTCGRTMVGFYCILTVANASWPFCLYFRWLRANLGQAPPDIADGIGAGSTGTSTLDVAPNRRSWVHLSKFHLYVSTTWQII